MYTNFSVTVSRSVSVLNGQLADGHELEHGSLPPRRCQVFLLKKKKICLCVIFLIDMMHILD